MAIASVEPVGKASAQSLRSSGQSRLRAQADSSLPCKVFNDDTIGAGSTRAGLALNGVMGISIGVLLGALMGGCDRNSEGLIVVKEKGDLLGWCVSKCPDVDGDGFPDLVIGAPGAQRGAGKVIVVGGNEGLLVSTNHGNDGIGDGGVGGQLSDGILLGGSGGPGFLAVGVECGAISVVSAATGNVVGTIRIGTWQEGAGSWLRVGGDWDKDGFRDYIIGVSSASVTGADGAGRVAIVSGRTGKSVMTISGASGNGQFGMRVGAPGDLNSDGVDDIVVGAPQAFRGGQGVRTGGVFAISGKDGGVLWECYGNVPMERFGNALEPIGDVNGDGFSDIVCGAGDSRVDGADRVGRVAMLSGKDGAVIWESRGKSPGGMFGASVCKVTDVDSDGVLDVAVGSPYSSPKSVRAAGQVDILSGKTGSIIRSVCGSFRGQGLGWDIVLLESWRGGSKPVLVSGTPHHGESGGVVIISLDSGSVVERL